MTRKYHRWIRDRRSRTGTLWQHCMDCGTERVIRRSRASFHKRGDGPDEWTSFRPECTP